MGARSNRLAPTLRCAAVIVAAAGLLSLLLSPQPAAAYCRASVCDDGRAGTLCTPPQDGDCGKPLFWSPPCVGYSVQQDASVQVPFEVANAVITLAFEAWPLVTCSEGGNPTLQAVNIGPVECDQAEYNQDGGNANIVMFRDEGWPHAGSAGTLALTTVTYDLDTGEIYDADMEINSADMIITISEVNVEYDLLSIITHEAGHAFGLAHTPDESATMYLDYMTGDISLRSLEKDDIDAICVAYPPSGGSLDSCDPTPRNGFKSTCGPQPEGLKGRCSCRVCPATSDPVDGFWLLAAAAAIWLVRGRRPGRRSADRGA